MRHLKERVLAGLGACRSEVGTPQADPRVPVGTVGTWRQWAASLPAGILRVELRRELALRWRAEAEQAQRSASLFASTSLALARLGAPPPLLSACQEVGLDDLCHAELALAMAARYADASGPALDLPMGNPHGNLDLELVMARWVREGCIGKTIGAAVLGERLRHATQPLVRHALEVLFENHVRHARLAYRVVAWTLEVGAESLPQSVDRCFEAALEHALEAPPTLRAGLHCEELNLHGRLGPFQLAHVTRLAVSEIVEPARARLLRVEEQAEAVARVVRHQPETRTRHTLSPQSSALERGVGLGSTGNAGTVRRYGALKSSMASR